MATNTFEMNIRAPQNATRLAPTRPWRASASVVSLLLAGMLLLGRPAGAKEVCAPQVGRFISISGIVQVQRRTGGRWLEADLDRELCEGDSIRVGEQSRAALGLINDAVLRIDQSTTIRLLNITGEPDQRSFLDLVKGALQSFSRKPRLLTVSTPYLNGSVEGTEFFARVEGEKAQMTVFEGRVQASNDAGELRLGAGQSAQATRGQGPRVRVLVRPRDQVQWALYYPPILSVSALGEDAPLLREAASCAAGGDRVCAFDRLQRVPATARDADFFLLRASLLLAVGRVEAARDDIDELLEREPRAGQGYSLRSVIAVVRNEREAALADARRGLELSPDSAAAMIALSYALQANLELESARDLLREAVARQPEEALAWARLAELELSLGRWSSATQAARRAVGLQPGLSRAQNALGFTALAEMGISEAESAFERAIVLDSADPLPRLGLGLVKIRRGHLVEGRRDLEAAVALDSTNALLRAYLGKAYFEERRGPLDAEQFAIAKDLDPLDPTAFFYDAIRLQTENRPVAARRELDGAIERNDNRAVYRGRLLLDQDRAGRGTSLARVYDDLGSGRQGVNEARRSLARDPANASAHRFLADSYLSVRRREIARVSELLQAQMLQDINLSPVQPSVAETNLNTLTGGGPSSVGLNEFTPLFERNGASLNLAGLVGSQSTSGGEVVASGIQDRLSLSAGAYHYDTEGWRPNNGLRQTIYNLFGQAALTPEWNLQAELRRRDSKEGDLAFNFDPSDFIADKRVDRELDTVRVGLRYSPSPGSNLLFSYIYGEREERLDQTEALSPITESAIDSRRKDRGYQLESQYIWEQARINLVAGLGYSQVDTRTDTSILLTDRLFGFPLLDISETRETDITHGRGYLYGNLDLSDRLVATLGLAYDDFDESPLRDHNLSPKAGLRWRASERLELRAAAFQTVKPPLVNNRTIEPTQIAGFNQFFDDINATKSRRYGFALDWRPRRDLSFSGELTWREMDEPVFRALEGDVVFEDRREELHRADLNWTPGQRWSLMASFVYDRYESDPGIATEFDNLPEKVETISLPLGLRYFDPSGVFAGLSGTYVDQEVRRSASATRASGSDDFFIVDLVVGYRLPRRRGVFSLEVKNLFDETFSYQDDSYREFRDEPSTGPYYPDVTILGQLKVNF